MSTGTSAPQERIIGGRSGRLADHPYIASLHLANAPICGATIISTRHVITAAHCFVNSTQPDDYTVIVGSEFYHPRGPFARTVAVESLIVHEKFNKKSNTNDIALLVLEEPLELIQGYIWPAELPKRNDALPFGKSGILTGWWVFGWFALYGQQWYTSNLNRQGSYQRRRWAFENIPFQCCRIASVGGRHLPCSV